MILAGLLSACAGSQPGTNGQPSLDLARTALASGAADLAFNASSAVVAREPSNASAVQLQGDALTALGRTDEAAARYRTALSLDPKSSEARIGLGRLSLASDPSAAEKLFLQSLEQDPRNAVALNNLGIARDLQGRHNEAQSAYRQAIALSPSMRGAEVNLALSLALSGKAREGEILLRPLASRPDASPREKQNMAAVAALAQDRETAEALLNTDLSPEQVRDALGAYETIRKSTP